MLSQNDPWYCFKSPGIISSYVQLHGSMRCNCSQVPAVGLTVIAISIKCKQYKAS